MRGFERETITCNNTWGQRFRKFKDREIRNSFNAVEWKKASLIAFFVYTIFAVDFLTHGNADSQWIFLMKCLVVCFMILKYIVKWSPGFLITRKISQFMALITKIYIPTPFRRFIYSTFGQQYGVITKDMVKPYKSYQNFNEFFTRQVKPRAINPSPLIAVSPADSKLLSTSQINSNDCLLVKRINYSVGHFLTGYKDYVIDKAELDAHYRLYPGSTIWSCVMYLAPGDYHRYHCPVDFLAKRRTHIVGSLAPVKESYISKTQGVYEGNERVVLQGEWKEGFMFIVFVGATNVGSMTVNFDPELNTNTCITPSYIANTQEYNSSKLLTPVKSPYVRKEDGVFIPKGAEIGRFNMGSTVVMVFESKSQIKWNIKSGDKLRYSSPIFQVMEQLV